MRQAEFAPAKVRAALDSFERELAVLLDDIRATATELQRGDIHPAHAANRLRRIANAIQRKETT